jgi:hypothetical protein
MKTRTKNGAETILLVAQNLLRDGRPRKPLGKPRPKHAGGKLSLPAALKMAQKMVGATRRQYEAAIEAAADEAYWGDWHGAFSPYDSNHQIIESYDEVELDTRAVIRTLRKATKSL